MANTAAIQAILPQIQCGLCGFAGCLPYAEALSTGQTDVHRCVPGGDVVLQKLSILLPNCLEKKPDCAPQNPTQTVQADHIVAIDPAHCIGCVLCIAACPVDAIVGAPKVLHQIIETQCTGCGLCLPPCPMDCIAFVPRADNNLPDFNVEQSAARWSARQHRLANQKKTEKTTAILGQNTKQNLAEILARRKNTP